MKAIRYLIFPFLALLISCDSQDKQTPQQKDKGKTGHYVTTAKAHRDVYVPKIHSSGTVKPVKEANVGATLPGKLENLLVEKGEHVSKGQMLAMMSGEMLTQAQVERDALKKDYNRVKRLHDKGSVTDQKLDHVKAEYDASKAKVKMLEQSTKIRAPFSGVVTDFLLQEGENYMFSPNLKPGYSMTSGIVQLMQLHPLEVHFDVNERDLRHLAPGHEVRIELMAFPDTIFYGEVHRTPDVLSTATRSGKVTARLPNPKHTIKPGMSADVTVFTAPDSVIFVPLESVFRPQGTDEDYVYQVENSTIERRRVKRIATVDDRVAVKGLPEDAQVVIAGKDGLEEGSRVIVKNK